jgi:hypothetical protein
MNWERADQQSVDYIKHRYVEPDTEGQQNDDT